MDIVKKNLPLIVIGVAATSIVLYMLLSRKDNSSQTAKEGNLFKEILEQRANQIVKEQ